ncbi:Mitochondrial carrier domain protein [Kalmanozyma brasiliensis GHG001]|uniref:Mitochondrial carrier domain protein n=1 Tax=Kalmanozyma brasiliensis (strain GHG001) TaxID=1365824 RepID=UPI001CE83BC1|nr:Mitochondrial carrier domain protein [Kalmanozyma brasiliensis GHG001]EST08046.2 Mitochondrial carrier domain protein [Kalmanozyma brasiliensis GHG001]
MSATSAITSATAGPSTSKDAEPSKKAVKRRNSTSKPSGSREPTRQESFGGAVIRALFGTLAFLFKRPVRLFRPVKLSSWTILEAMAKREGRTLSLRYLRTLLRRENSNFIPHLLLPPLLFNTAIGFTLFEAYSITESRLLAKAKRKKLEKVGQSEEGEVVDDEAKPKWTPLWIVTASGAVAGAAQCFLSAPLDNVRYIIQRSNARHHSGHAHPITTISWRAILRAAILPFAPAIARDKLVQDVQNETIERSKRAPKPTLRARLIALIEPATTSIRNARNGNASVAETFTMSPEKRQEWEKRLKRWRGGVHGSGLALSLIRDSVGFGSFFFIFEVSRRGAFFASTAVDRVSAWFNAGGLGIVRPRGPAVDQPQQQDEGSNVVGRRKSDDRSESSDEMHIEDAGQIGRWIRDGQRSANDADVSYNQSRTVEGRIVAVIILLIGGAVGALSYELVGRPFELMRVVIFEGRKQWEQGKREPGYRSHSKSTRAASRRTHSQPDSGATGFSTVGRPVVKGARVSAADRAKQLGGRAFQRRPDFLVLRAANKSGNQMSRIFERAMLPRPPHPLRLVAARSRSPATDTLVKPMLTSTRALQARKAQQSSAPSPSPLKEETPSSTESTECATSTTRAKGRSRRPQPSLATRPGFLTLLIEHAQSTAKLDRLHAGGLDPSKASIPLLLLHTYFVAPFLPEIPKPVLDNEIVRAAAGVDKQLRPSSNTATPTISIPDKISTVAQRTLLMSLASRRRAADSPEAKMKKNWTLNNPVSSSLVTGNGKAGPSAHTARRAGGFGASDKATLAKGGRYWGSGRVVWALKRLASPYGVAFLVFAWLGGDLN